jgi:hypothetical protein
MELSINVKESFAAGWNSPAHLHPLKSTYKARYFADLPVLSRSLVSKHFEFFYQNLKPIDDELEDTVASYAKVSLQGSDMIGHNKVLMQIKYNYKLRINLYAYNT